ncbi:ParB/RepB/Spo0J family partition protein [Actinosynnema sp. NPDC050436]|uniref:ParB/RepB/Spo0J family partition protein n=1 Tax=Actinosynnema sp. NPDC050436 TaxID=3155659 RepID=UPI0033DE9238
MVPVSRLLPGDSPRKDASAAHVEELAAVGAPLPPITVHRASMRVIDGAHRLRAARLRGDRTIAVRFFDGDERDAFVLAVRLNTAHGLPLTLAERKAAAQRVIGYHPQWSDRAIAAVVGVSDKTVAALRGESGATPPFERLGRDGRYYPRDRVAGRLRAGEIFARNPKASPLEVARVAGISATTAKDVRARVRRGEDPVPETHRARLSGGRAATPVGAPSPDRRTIARRLRADPSMRFSESGRTLLRRLDGPGTDPAEWVALAGSVPGHCKHVVAELARMCAEDWLRFAAALENRSATAC